MADDLVASSVRLNAAKKAAVDLHQLCSVCTTTFLREEGAVFVNEALNVIKLIEESIDNNAAKFSSHLLDEAVNSALLKTEDVLRALAGRIAEADRQSKPRNAIRQLANSNKQMFEDARKLLGKVLPPMAETAYAGPEFALGIPTGSAGIGSSDSTRDLLPSALSVESEGIRPHHIVDDSELVLQEVIGSGPEDAAESTAAGSSGDLQDFKVMQASHVVPAEDSPFYVSFRESNQDANRHNMVYSTGSTAAALEAAVSAADIRTSLGSAPVNQSRVAADVAGVAGVEQDEDSWPAPGRQQQQQNRQAASATTRAGVAPVAAGAVPASRRAANPMSRESAMARGVPGYLLSETGPNWQVLPVSSEDQASGWRAEHSQSMPRGSAVDAGGFSGNLEASLSTLTWEGIRPHQVICKSELTLKEVIGSGAEGKVYRGTRTNIDIAAKEYWGVDDDDTDSAVGNSDTSSEAAMQRARNALRKEVALLMCFNHPNLVRFCGVCLDPPLVVMEFYKHGNVFQMMEKARRQWLDNQARPGAPTTKQATKYMNYFTWDRRLEMLHDVSAGMMYLHKRHYIHGDLRSSNLFVGLDGRVKIGDFGFKNWVNSQQSMQVKRITHSRWVAPELMTDYRLSAESDVYSFGIIMYEMLTWQLPFYDLTTEQVVYHVMAGSGPDIPVDEQLPPGTSSSTCLSSYIKLMQECWDQDMAKRPQFDRIAARLKAMIRWRMVIQRNRILARAAAKLKVAGQAHTTVPVTWSAITTVTDAPEAIGSVAAGTPPAAQKVLQMSAPKAEAAFAAGSASASSPPLPDMAALAIDEDDHKPLPRPEHPIVQLPDLVAEAVIDRAAVEPPVIPVARARTAPAAAVAQVTDKAAEAAEAAAYAKVQSSHLRPQAPSRWQQPQVPWLQQQQWRQAAVPTPTEAAGASTSALDLGSLLHMPVYQESVFASQQRPASYATQKQLQLGLPGCTAVLAHHTSNGQQVLLLQLQLWQHLQPARQEQLLQDLRGAARQRHPHVLRLQDARLSSGRLKCVTDPCSVSLVQFVQQRGGRLGESLSRWLFQQLVLGVDYCHRLGGADSASASGEGHTNPNWVITAQSCISSWVAAACCR